MQKKSTTIQAKMRAYASMTFLVMMGHNWALHGLSTFLSFFPRLSLIILVFVSAVHLLTALGEGKWPFTPVLLGGLLMLSCFYRL